MDKDKISITLRDYDAKPFIAVEVEAEGFDFKEQFKEFLRKAQSLSPEVLDGHKVDVVIGYWGTQGELKLTVDFVRFCAFHSIPIDIGFND